MPTNGKNDINLSGKHDHTRSFVKVPTTGTLTQYEHSLNLNVYYKYEEKNTYRDREREFFNLPLLPPKELR